MVINRRTFNVKPGCMEAAIKLLKDTEADFAAVSKSKRPTWVLSTAMFGPFDVLAMEAEYEDQDQYRAYTDELFSSPVMGPFFEAWNLLIVGGGSNELWETW
jgi:hypothetical protein